MTPSLFHDVAPASKPTFTPEDFNDIKLWKPLPPVDPTVDNHAWATERSPVCVYDGRKWARKKPQDLVVSCSGPAEHWIAEAGRQYGYCAYHWTLRQHGQLFAGNTVPNPKYTEKDRARDHAIIEKFWEDRVKQ